VLEPEQRAAWESDGYLVLPRLLPAVTVQAMHDRVVELARADADGEPLGHGAFVIPEKNFRPEAESPEARVSKVFLLHHWDPVFGPIAHWPTIVDLVAELAGPDLDCFLSQFIFKNPGAIGQPWHQDSFYFPFEPDRQVGVWIAVTDAAIDNGPLWVLPGSHREPVHEHVADTRPAANFGYTEIVDHDTSEEIPVLLEPGDVLLFDSHLMHRSTDNGSDRLRAAMVYHYSRAGTIDRTRAVLAAAADALGELPDGAAARVEAAEEDGSYYIWTPVLRDGEPAR
jgi:phytanoyl-CoA hydroxylase